MGDRRRSHAWRKTLHGSRPATPVNCALEATAGLGDTMDDACSETSEASTCQRHTRAKLARYTTLFGFYKEAPKPLEFSEFWGDEEPASIHPRLDPAKVMQSIQSHMVNWSFDSIPLNLHSGLFCVFEDYRKVSEQLSQAQLQCKEWEHQCSTLKEQWGLAEEGYQTEIGRLELVIAKGQDGMAQLVRARQNTVIGRNRHQSRNQAPRGTIPDSSRMIAQRSTKVPTFATQQVPSKDMTLTARTTVPNRQSTTMLCGYGPRASQKALRGAQSAHVVRDKGEAANDVIHSRRVTQPRAHFPGGVAGDTESHLELPMTDDGVFLGPTWNETTNMAQENAEIVACATLDDRYQQHDEELENEACPITTPLSTPVVVYQDGAAVTLHQAHHSHPSQPVLVSWQKRRRHFSFEPGDDEIRTLQQGLDSPNSNQLEDRQIRSVLPCSASAHALDGESTCSKSALWLSPALSMDSQKPSKIPSPVPSSGRMHRGSSNSSTHSTLTKVGKVGPDSRCSTFTAVRTQSNASMRSASTGNSAMYKPVAMRAVASPMDSPGTVRDGHATAVVAAARAWEGVSARCPQPQR